MREIKFRAWCNGEMITPAVWVNDENLPCYSLGSSPKAPLMQYTGLKDANGVEIYEGDIIKSNSYPFYGDALDGRFNELNYLGSVGIDPDGCYYDLHVVSDRVRGAACGGNLSEINEVCVAIGNIHENPELLK